MKKFRELSEQLKKDKDDPCWKGYVQLGTKKKNGKEVPNCVPKEEKESVEEKAVSQAQQKMMGMALAYKRGEMPDASPEVKKMADSMSMKDLEDFAKTKHKGLPVRKESVELEEMDLSKHDSKKLLQFYRKYADKKMGPSDANMLKGVRRELMKRGVSIKEEVEEKAGAYSRYTASELKKRRDEREKRNAGTTQAQRIKNKMYGGMMGGLKKEEAELDEAFTPKEIKMAIGVASDKRYAGGNMTGAVNAIEKIKKGLSDHPQVRAVLRRQNESVEMENVIKSFFELRESLQEAYMSPEEAKAFEAGKRAGREGKPYSNNPHAGRDGQDALSTAWKKGHNIARERRYKSIAKAAKGAKNLLTKESVELGEALKDAAKDTYFNTYSAAVQYAKAQAEKQGYEVDEDDWFRQVNTGKGKPGRGKTTRHTLKLMKNGKPTRKGLAIQVYNRDTDKNPYELNYYVS